jgi:hypothetical protein
VLLAGSTPAASTITKLLIFQQLVNSDGKIRAKLYSHCTVDLRFAPIRRFDQNLAEAGVQMLSVYHPDCKNAGDKTWRRCGCPKWIWGSLNGKFIRQSCPNSSVGTSSRISPSPLTRRGNTSSFGQAD